MLLQELLRHAADNVEAGRLSAFGLEYSGVNISDNISILAFCFDNPEKYSLAPRTHKVNGFEVPMAMEVQPELCSHYYTIDFSGDNLCCWVTWGCNDIDLHLFKRGLCFATKESAQQNALAMLGYDLATTKVGDV